VNDEPIVKYCADQPYTDEQLAKMNPPVAKYTLTLTITGNSHDEIETELAYQSRGTYLLNSDYQKRDEFLVYGGRYTSKLVHTNPEMTPERYESELSAWSKRRGLFHD
jgi:hypothetical protein